MKHGAGIPGADLKGEARARGGARGRAGVTHTTAMPRIGGGACRRGRQRGSGARCGRESARP